MVGTRTKCISLVRALWRQHGVQVGSGAAGSFVARVRALGLDADHCDERDRVDRFSGQSRHRGRITKTGNRRLRSLLIEAAWCMLRHPTELTRISVSERELSPGRCREPTRRWRPSPIRTPPCAAATDAASVEREQKDDRNSRQDPC